MILTLPSRMLFSLAAVIGLLNVSCVLATPSNAHPHPSPASDRKYPLYITTYDSVVEPLTYDARRQTIGKSGASLQEQKPNITIDSPSWIHHHQSRFYITGEAAPGRVYVATAKSTGTPLHVVGRTDGYLTGGNGPVKSQVVGQCLYVAHYDSGSATVLQLDNDGLPAQHGNPARVFQYKRKGVGPVGSSQNQTHAHDTTVSPDGKWVYVPDPGSDVIHRIRTASGSQSCTHARDDGSTRVAAGSGPRHIVFHQRFAYVSSELGTSLTAFAYDPRTGALKQIGAPALAVPAGTALGGTQYDGPARTVSEVALTADGRAAYVGTQGDAQQDHIAHFSRNATSGAVTFVAWYPSGGKGPRHFSLSHDERFVAVAHLDTGNVVVLARDGKTGALSETGAVMTKDMADVGFAGFV